MQLSLLEAVCLYQFVNLYLLLQHYLVVRVSLFFNLVDEYFHEYVFCEGDPCFGLWYH